ncbi:hypothetical protein EVAR_46587_1 [Eumeta japonica]|uniref:Uncharacterized protein n=1 Tax=Eumeta variegata TaxID=151549 RepID=A0A4C1WR40_EUMVA|nr:hypothetical protein EVAR_46587_1 [Eumeta japonica]
MSAAIVSFALVSRRVLQLPADESGNSGAMGRRNSRLSASLRMEDSKFLVQILRCFNNDKRYLRLGKPWIGSKRIHLICIEGGLNT